MTYLQVEANKTALSCCLGEEFVQVRNKSVKSQKNLEVKVKSREFITSAIDGTNSTTINNNNNIVYSNLPFKGCFCIHLHLIVYIGMCAQQIPTPCDPTDCSPPGSSVHRIFQARIVEWVAHSTPGDLPHPGVEPESLHWQVDSLPLSYLGSSLILIGGFIK